LNWKKNKSTGKSFPVPDKFLNNDGTVDIYDLKERMTVKGENPKVVIHGKTRMIEAENPNPRYNHKLYKTIGRL